MTTGRDAGLAGRPDVTVQRLDELPATEAMVLTTESEEAGHGFVRRLVDEWRSGANRFDRPGEALFGAWSRSALVGVCGLNVDPYAGTDDVGRVRHLYVALAHRRLGTGQLLVGAVIDAAQGRFRRLRLRTSNPAAAQLYERAGFRRIDGEADCTHVMEMRR